MRFLNAWLEGIHILSVLQTNTSSLCRVYGIIYLFKHIKIQGLVPSRCYQYSPDGLSDDKLRGQWQSGFYNSALPVWKMRPIRELRSSCGRSDQDEAANQILGSFLKSTTFATPQLRGFRILVVVDETKWEASRSTFKHRTTSLKFILGTEMAKGKYVNMLSFHFSSMLYRQVANLA